MLDCTVSVEIEWNWSMYAIKQICQVQFQSDGNTMNISYIRKDDFYKNNKQHFNYYRCTLTTVEDCLVVWTHQSNFGSASSLHKKEHMQRLCVNRLFFCFGSSCCKRYISKFLELNILAIFLTLLEPKQPRAFSARLLANSLTKYL